MKVQSKLTDHIVVNDGNQQEELCEGFGDQMIQKGEEVIRICFQNINGIKGKITASHEVFDAIIDKELDIMGIAEMNVKSTDRVKQEAQFAVKMRFGK